MFQKTILLLWEIIASCSALTKEKTFVRIPGSQVDFAVMHLKSVLALTCAPLTIQKHQVSLNTCLAQTNQLVLRS